MPQCQNCGNRVSEQYAKVKWDTVDDVPACPQCPDKKIEDGSVHEYRGL